VRIILDFKRILTTPENLEQYVALFTDCFPQANLYSFPYLKWQYVKNPAGLVFGFDAFDREHLAAHYACIPVFVNLRGKIVKALLSLNTATHPKYQRRGLFTKLASLTYDEAIKHGFTLIYGVANKYSTNGFVRKLGFQLVSPLDARIGFGRLSVKDWKKVYSTAEFRRHWDSDSIKWRISNPINPGRVLSYNKQTNGLQIKTGKYGIRAYTECESYSCFTESSWINLLAPRVFIGLFPSGTCRFTGYFTLPNFLKPSPLNLIYLNLNSNFDRLNRNNVLISFIDFDAF
jgi:GNAT superfamily N-acetyltransferase